MDESLNSSVPSMQDYYNMIKAEHEANNAWSAEQAQKAMDYQTQMSNTAHQREVEDLKAAGLNPVLSAGGSGATTGSGIIGQRSDNNVDALYGLVKQAIDANYEQAKALQNSSRSAYAGVGSLGLPIDSEEESWLSAAGDAFADWLYRKTGIKQVTTKKLLGYAKEGAKDVLEWLDGESDALVRNASSYGLDPDEMWSFTNASGSSKATLDYVKHVVLDKALFDEGSLGYKMQNNMNSGKSYGSVHHTSDSSGMSGRSGKFGLTSSAKTFANLKNKFKKKIRTAV